ncbi:30S ribosome-binding factor RbfA [Ruminococcaceae bacterium OttesenSCG-928-O06]|nr:30S ribosome-binding factor RbfA [Ruminococcaceae bacterium OttesenSCG-928-O06]
MPKKGPSKNIARLNEDIKREMIDIIAAMRDPRLQGGLLTVTRVDTTNDLTQTKVYISVMDRPGGAKEVLQALQAARGHVRSEIASRMHIRKAPQVLFIEDDNAAYAAHINELLKDLKDE